MGHERLILLDSGADPVGECRLRQRNSDAAIGDVAGGAKQARLGQLGQQVVKAGFGIEIERRRRAPKAAKNHLRKFRAAEGRDFRGGVSVSSVLRNRSLGGEPSETAPAA